MDKTERLASILKESRNLCVFTGAGISVPSGIPDFRSANGLYHRETNNHYSPEQIISHSFFERRPQDFFSFYKSSMLFPDAKPNEAHLFFASLEQQGKEVSVVTQNIDGLHQAAGSTHVMELHGSVHRNYCQSCSAFYSLADILSQEGVPLCKKCGGVIKPDVVLYEEPLDNETVMEAIRAIRKADTMVVVGTSLVVYPAASYLHYFGGSNLILINKSETAFDGRADLTINDDVVHVVRQLKELGV